jgi:hypothetical protein
MHTLVTWTRTLVPPAFEGLELPQGLLSNHSCIEVIHLFDEHDGRSQVPQLFF